LRVWNHQCQIRTKRRRHRRLVKRVNAPCETKWTKFRGEMHLPGHNFTGPGTKLDKRLNENGMPKWWSRPVNRVDRAAYHHDLAYAKYKNRAKRIEAYNKMIRALGAIDKPTLRERLEKAVVRPIISAKASTYKYGCTKYWFSI